MSVSAVDPPAGSPAARFAARLRDVLKGTSDASKTSRLATTIFAIRVISAGMAYGSQILLARWMGSSEYGIFVYVWTWVLLIGALLDFGIAISAQKLIPEYRARGQMDHLRGFLSGSLWLTGLASSVIALLLAGTVYLFEDRFGRDTAVPLYLGCATLPPFVLGNMQDGIARTFDWMRLALMPQFIVRQSLIIAFTAGAASIHFDLGAVAAMGISAACVWIAQLGQLTILQYRLRKAVPAGPKRHDIGGWLNVSLPILLVESFYQLLSYTDVLILQQFRPADEVGVYFAVVKTLALVSFIHYAMSATTAHRFTAYHVAGDKAGLAAYVAHSIKWTFYPSLAATLVLLAIGKPMLWLFGSQFTSGYGIMFVAALGLLVRSAIGPVERLLNMLGHQYACASAYAAAFVANLVLCFLLVPRYGGYGAAAATTLALAFETVLLFMMVRWKLGLHVLAFGKRGS
jgi:O-antigen/teichoic acid export membrane protein